MKWIFGYLCLFSVSFNLFAQDMLPGIELAKIYKSGSSTVVNQVAFPNLELSESNACLVVAGGFIPISKPSVTSDYGCEGEYKVIRWDFPLDAEYPRTSYALIDTHKYACTNDSSIFREDKTEVAFDTGFVEKLGFKKVFLEGIKHRKLPEEEYLQDLKSVLFKYVDGDFLVTKSVVTYESNPKEFYSNQVAEFIAISNDGGESYDILTQEFYLENHRSIGKNRHKFDRRTSFGSPYVKDGYLYLIKRSNAYEIQEFQIVRYKIGGKAELEVVLEWYEGC